MNKCVVKCIKLLLFSSMHSGFKCEVTNMYKKIGSNSLLKLICRQKMRVNQRIRMQTG